MTLTWTTAFGLPKGATSNGPVDEMEWELFNLIADPFETNNIWSQTDISEIQAELEAVLARLQVPVADQPFRSPS